MICSDFLAEYWGADSFTEQEWISSCHCLSENHSWPCLFAMTYGSLQLRVLLIILSFILALLKVCYDFFHPYFSYWPFCWHLCYVNIDSFSDCHKHCNILSNWSDLPSISFVFAIWPHQMSKILQPNSFIESSYWWASAYKINIIIYLLFLL